MIHNTGTPQEMIDEERDFIPESDGEKLLGCIFYLIYLLILVLIFYLLN